MTLRLPPRLRIVVASSDQTPAREYVLGRPLLVGLVVTVVLLAALVVQILASYASLAARLRQAEAAPQEMTAGQAAARIEELSGELERMRALQEKLLTMLGVEVPPDSGGRGQIGAGGSADSAGAAVAGVGARSRAGPPRGTLDEASRLIITPPPDRWPIVGHVTREFAADEAGGGGHEGIDLVAELDTPIRAAGKGRVVKVGEDPFLGNYVEIAHGFGYVTVYGHCSRVTAREGDRVDSGQVVAFLGGTGQVTAPHLHFEVWKGGVAVNPRLVIPGDPRRL